MTDFPALDEESAARFLDPPSDKEAFVRFIQSFYHAYGRPFSWRETDDVYAIFLSEVMLQQTQTGRVLEKWKLFLSKWPTLRDLACAPFPELLEAWQGLGYNRRALNLQKTAKASEAYGWTLPDDEKALLSLPGVGPSTAAAVLAFGYHKPAVYLETNIRRVLLFSFHKGEDGVSDTVLRGELETLLQWVDDVKDWYYALMDYGVLLKHLVPNPNVHSRTYHRQSRFEGSNRQVRGRLLAFLASDGPSSREVLYEKLSFGKERVDQALDSLVKDGMVHEKGAVYDVEG